MANGKPKENLVFEGRWGECKKHFTNLLSKVSSSYDTHTVFRDAVRTFSISFQSALTLDEEKKKILEDEYKSIADKYGKSGMEKISEMLAIVVDALEQRRTDFLGRIYEDINATVKSFAQYLTPESVSRLMGAITFSGGRIQPGRIVTMCDPTCGAGALLIDAAESFLASGGRQGDIVLFGDDLDATAANIAFVQFCLLGYPAVVRRMDSLAMTVYDGPWYTFGYFAHGIPVRMQHKNGESKKFEDPAEPISESPSVKIPEETINVRNLTQEEFNF